MGPTKAEQAPSFVSHRPVLAAAYDFAARWHAGQQRESDAAAFIVHPLEVGALLAAVSAPEHVIVAGMLHDVLEKTDATPAEIQREFGSRVTRLVVALTEDPTIEPFAARKAALIAQIAAEGPAAGAISAADKVAKIRELRTRIAQARVAHGADPDDSERKLAHYRATLESLERQIPAHPLVGQLRFELETLAALPPGVGPVAGLGVRAPGLGV
jgi:(p)ppGpp synthase/HD superfamily hydrolase